MRRIPNVGPIAHVSESYFAGSAWYDMVGYRDAPLSGEFAGESIPEIAHTFGFFPADTMDLDEFELGFFEAHANQ